MPRVRITELLHEVNRATGFVSAFSNLRTGEQCEDDSARLAAILADATNLGLGRMAAASHEVTRDKLVWTADAYIRRKTYKAALSKIINAHHALPVAGTWGDGTTSSPDRQFFRSGKRGDAAGDVNARTDVTRVWVSAPTSPISTSLTMCGLCRRPVTKRHTCWTASCIMEPGYESGRTTPTRVAPPTTYSSCVRCWGFDSVRG